MKLNFTWLIMLPMIATIGLTTACGGDEGCEPASEEACECTRSDGSVRDGFRVCDSELEDWGDCVCAARSVRLCNVLTVLSSTPGETIETLECTVEIAGAADSVSYKALTGACDEPTGSFCRPLPADENPTAKMTCVVASTGELYLDWQDIPFDNVPLPGANIDYGLIVNSIDGFPSISIIEFPAPDLVDESITYETCEDYAVPTFDELEALVTG